MLCISIKISISVIFPEKNKHNIYHFYIYKLPYICVYIGTAAYRLPISDPEYMGRGLCGD